MGWFSSKWFYKSYTIAKYVVGEEVYLTREIPDPWLGTCISPNPPKYVVTSVSDKPTGGLIWKEFVYSIKDLSTGVVRTKVYESEMRPAGKTLGRYRLDYRHMDYHCLEIAIPRSIDWSTRASLYNDNVLELTYDIRTGTYTLWFDPEFEDRYSLVRLFTGLMWQDVSQDRVIAIQNSTINSAWAEDLDSIDASTFWTGPKAFQLMVRLQRWLSKDKEFQDTHLPSADSKIVRLDKEPPEDPLYYRWEKKCIRCDHTLMYVTTRNEKTDTQGSNMDEDYVCHNCGKHLYCYWHENPLPFRYERGNDTFY
jgi:hypothetical protein